MKQIWISAVLAISLAACGGSDSSAPEADYEALQNAPKASSVAEFRREAIAADEAAPEPVQTGGEEVAAQYIAYTYNLGLRMPQASVEPVMQAHVQACEAAGSAVCIVTNSNINNQSDDATSGYLSLRAKPDWIETFLSTVDDEVAEVDGEVVNRNKQSVDLTRTILDTDARLNAKITLKRRLENLLATREGTLSDLLQVERELARVTGEIESITSNLKALRLRVSMSEMTLNYETRRSLVSGGRQNPLAAAFGDFFYNMSEALAAVITFFAVGLPWMILVGIFLFIWTRAIWPWVRKKRAKS